MFHIENTINKKDFAKEERLRTSGRRYCILFCFLSFYILSNVEKGVERLRERGHMRCLKCRQTAENPCCSLPFPHNAHPASTRPVFDHLYSETACNRSILTSFFWELLYTLTLPAKHSQGVRLTEQVLMEVFGIPRANRPSLNSLECHLCVFILSIFPSINLLHIDAT